MATPLWSTIALVGTIQLLSAAALLAAPPDAAQTAPVVIEATKPTAERDPTSATEVIQPGDGDAARSVGDILDPLTGVHVRQEGGFGRRLTLSLRGTDNQQALVLLDDVPLNTALGGGVDLSQFSLSGVEAVELYRGGSALLGGNAVGGAIRIRSRNATDVPLTTTTIGAGSFGAFALSGHHSSTHGELGLVGSYSIRQSDGRFSFVDGNGAARVRENNDSRGIAMSARANHPLSRHVTLSVAHHANAEHRGAPGVEQFPTLVARLDDQRNISVARVEVETSSTTRLESSAWHQLRALHYLDPDPVLPPAVDNEHIDHIAGGHGTWTSWGLENHVVQIRLEGSGEWAQIEREDLSQTPTRSIFGGVVSDEWSLWSDRLLLIGAVRADHTSEIGLATLPKLGLAHNPHRLVRFTANASRAYRAPTFEELYYDAGFVRGNPDLRPEDAWSLDAALRVGDDDLSVQLGGFWIDIDNLILFLPTTAFLLEANNSKRAISRGLESELHWNASGTIGIRAAYTLVDARFNDTGLRLPARSPHRVHGRIVMRLTDLEAFVGADWQSAMTLDRFEQLEEEARWMVGAGVNVRPTHWLHLGVEGKNLLNKQDAVDSLQQPLPGRSVFGTATIRL